MWVGVVSLFPEMLDIISGHGVVARAIEQGVLELVVDNPRDHATDRHATVDDRPYGGGPGMVMKVEPVLAAVRSSKARAPVPPRVIYLSPQGDRLDQQRVQALAMEPAVTLIAGRYEGVDERLLDAVVDEELSIGDYVLTGGELPVMVVIDAVARCLPGTLGNPESAAEESHRDGLLDWPHYTRPERVLGRDVPEVLLSGDHGAVNRWRLAEALSRTYERRPDMLARRAMSAEERDLLRDRLDALARREDAEARREEDEE